LFIIVEIVLKEQVEKYALHENNEKLENILINQKALHKYVENIQKPVIYNLKKENKLYNGFFHPNLMSFTYIARNIHQIENKLLEENNRSIKYYKLASNNPRNPINTANEFEKNLITKFNQKELKEYKTIIDEDGEKFLYYAKPVNANQKSCMRCHGNPNDAPQDMRDMYGDSNGFNEKLGDIRAIISIKIPLTKELNHAHEYVNLISIILGISLLIVYFIIYYLMKKIDKKQLKLEHLVNIDQLTQCNNRRSFEQDMQSQIELSKRTHSSFSLISFDIDYFKSINDTFGHQIGDEVLIQICKIIHHTNRKYDKLYRIGGEEFMVLCPNTNLENAKQVANRMRDDIENYKFKETTITISLGVTQYNGKDDFEKVYKKVDDTLYLAKENGRNRVEIYEEKL